jgi:hypothetical protein
VTRRLTDFGLHARFGGDAGAGVGGRSRAPKRKTLRNLVRSAAGHPYDFSTHQDCVTLEAIGHHDEVLP